jgi:hypothetical protein
MKEICWGGLPGLLKLGGQGCWGAGIAPFVSGKVSVNFGREGLRVSMYALRP